MCTVINAAGKNVCDVCTAAAPEEAFVDEKKAEDKAKEEEDKAKELEAKAEEERLAKEEAERKAAEEAALKKKREEELKAQIIEVYAQT